MAITFTLMVLNPKKVVVELDCERVDVRHLPDVLHMLFSFSFFYLLYLKGLLLTVIFLPGFPVLCTCL